MDASESLEARLRAVCAAAGLTVVRIEWLPAALSLRRFARIHAHGTTAVARIEMPEDPAARPTGAAPEPPHEPIRALLERAGLPVPHRIGGDPEAGIELLEDVGSLSLERAAARATPPERFALYREACAWVPRIQSVARTPGVAAFDRALDAPLFAYKGDLVARYGLAARGRDATPAEHAVVGEAFARIAHEMEAAPRRLAHRDYQSANLFVDDRAPDGARLRMIDLQGALVAPPEYDLVCVLRDSYVELPDAELAAHVDAVRPALPDAPDPETFARRFDLLTLTRKGKDHARFLYAARERGDRRYLAHVPATVRYLRAAAARAARRDSHLADLAALLHDLPEVPCER